MISQKPLALFLITLIPLAGILLTNCKKDQEVKLPEVTTKTVINISNDAAECGGVVTSDAGEIILSRGVCWSTGSMPSIQDSKTEDGAGGGEYTSLITGLSTNTTYYVRAYVTNKNGTGYGIAMSFKTINTGPPIVITTAVTEITESSAMCGGIVTSDGNSPVQARGICWGKEPAPTIMNNHTNDGSDVGSYTTELTHLEANTKYYVRAYATNAFGTTYGNDTTFITLIDPYLLKLAGTDSKTWKLLRDVSGDVFPLEMGPWNHSTIWWAMGLGNNELFNRPCMLNDEFTFYTDGTYIIDRKGDYWAETQIYNPDFICASTDAMTGVNGEDLSAWGGGTFSFTFDGENKKVTAIGVGAFIGFERLEDGKEVTNGTSGSNPITPPPSVTYNIISLYDGDVDTLIVEGHYQWDASPGGYWRFALVHYDNPDDEPPLP